MDFPLLSESLDQSGKRVNIVERIRHGENLIRKIRNMDHIIETMPGMKAQ